MKPTSRAVLALTLSAAFLFGFLEPLWPQLFISCKRLHIFLFNLLGGGVLIVYFTEAKDCFTARAKLFFLTALLYALSAALSWYWLTLLLSLPLLAILESVRIRRFGWFPADFFRPSVAVHRKYHQASCLCLSIGVVIAAGVMLNNEYLHWISFGKLTLDVFFLGYSFPISLITMSVIFSCMSVDRRGIALLQEIAFWIINLGVIIFFVFIICELYVAEITIATLLFFTVCTVFVLFITTTPRLQQRAFLVSGMTFLLLTGLTGIGYLLRYFVHLPEEYTRQLLLLHAMLSLYGWNLSGLFIIIRWTDFPIRLHSTLAITLHWVIVALLAPIGRSVPAVALVAMPAFVALLALVFLSRAMLERGRDVMQGGTDA